MLRPRTMQGEATSSLATIVETEQPIVIEDDEDATRTGASASSRSSLGNSHLADQEKFFVEGTSNR